MLNVPTRRLFVYIAAGLIVLVVGTLGLLSMRSGSDGPVDGVVIESGDAGTGAVGADFGSVGLRDGLGSATLSSETTTTQLPRIWVQVAGAVRRPGVYQVSANARVFEAVSEAGGFADDADQQSVALAARLGDGCRVYVPRMGESAAGEIQSPAESSAGITGGSSAGGSSSGGGSPGPVNLNSASLDELDGLPGIGPSLAQQIVTYRETHGPFASIDELDDVPGIGAAKLEQLRPLVGL